MARNTLARRRNGRLSYLREGGDGGGGGGTGGAGGGEGGEGGAGGTGGSGESGGGAGGTGGAGGGTDRGYPENTPLADMTVDQREAYHRYHSRKWQGVAESRKDYDQLKADSVELARIRAEQMTPSDRAIAEAKDAARAEERAAQAPRLVRAEFRAAVVGRTVNGQPVDLDALLEDVDLTKYLKDDGDVDTAKVTARLDKLAPAGQSGGQGGGGGTGGGQQQRHGAGGNRSTGGGKPDVSETTAAMERALGRRPKKASSNA